MKFHNRARQEFRFIESLEIRRLFARTLHVTDFGAVPNDTVDDSPAIQAAMNAAQPGDTVEFAPGRYLFKHQLTVPAGLKLVGDKGAILQAPPGRYCFQTDPNNSSDLFIAKFEVDGRLLRIDNSYGGWSSNIEIAGCTFDAINLYKKGTEAESIFIPTGAKNLWIHDNVINNVFGDGFVVGYGYQNVDISDNTFNNGNEGVHYLGNYGNSSGLIVSENQFNNMHSMCLELQAGGQGVTVEDNIIEGAAVYRDFSENMNTFGLSIACDSASNIVVRRNKIVSYDREDGTGMRIGIELAGTNLQCYDNDIEGPATGIELNTSKNAVVRDNRIIDSSLPMGIYPGRTPGAKVSDNGSNVTLDWDPATLMQPPKADKRRHLIDDA